MTDRDPLDALAEEFLDRHRRGEWPQISEYIARYPALADDIREVFPPLVLLERAAQAGPGSAGDAARIGPYRLLRLLGRGGQGEVHLAEDTRLGRRVALKVLPQGVDPSGQLLARFKREAEITARLDHPGICTVFEAGEDRGTAYIAMRYVEGECLSDRLAADARDAGATGSATRDGVARIVAMGEKIARALEVAHSAGLIHRDIKPGNLMLTPDGEPVILDFGLARDIADEEPALTRTGMMMGTPIYMSPEQIAAERQRVDHRTDIYSLGVTLYECLTRRRPFEAATWEQLYHQILSVEPDDPRRLNPVIPRDLRVVLATAMDKDRDRRYQTAAAFADDLRNVRELQPIHAKPAGPLLRGRRWAQRNPVLATSVAALFVALAAGLVVTAILLGDARTERDAKARALRKASGLSLAAQSLAIVERDPSLALSLAIEAAERAPGAQANGALLRALTHDRELARFDAGHNVWPERPTLAFLDGGRRLLGPYSRETIWDLESGSPIATPLPSLYTFAVSPDQTRIVTGGIAERFLSVRDMSTGATLVSLRWPKNMVRAVASAISYSPDGQRIASGGDVWNAADGRFLVRFDGTVLFAPEGRDLLAWSRKRVVRWSEQEGPVTVCEPKDGAIVAVCWDSAFVATPDGIQVVDAKNGVVRRVLAGAADPVEAAWVDARGRTLFAVTRAGRCHLWSVTDGVLRNTVGLDECFDGARNPRRFDGRSGVDVAFSPHGDRLLFSAVWANTAALFDTAAGERYAELRGHEAGIVTAAFHPNGDSVATCSIDGTVRHWNARREMPVVMMRLPGDWIDSIEFSPDGSTVLGVANYDIFVWDRRSGLLVQRIDADVFRAHYAGRFILGIALGDQRVVRLWDAATGTPVEPPLSLRGDFDELALSDDGSLLATLRDGHVRVVALDDGLVLSEITPPQEESGSGELAFGPHGRLLATTIFADQATTIWEAATGGRVARIPVPGGAEHVRLTPDGRFVVAVDDIGAIRLSELPGGREVAVFWGSPDWVVSTAMGPNGRYFATVSRDGTARVVDLVARKSLYALAPGVGGLNVVRIGPRAEHLLLVTFDGEALLCALATGDLVVHLHREEGRRISGGFAQPGELLADFAPDGESVVTTSWDGTVRVWPVRPLALAYARPLTEAERARFVDPLRDDYDALRAARRLVDTLRYELLVKQDVLDRIRTEPGLAEDVRTLALRLAREQEHDAWMLETVYWRILLARDRPAADYRYARRLVQEVERIGGRGVEVAPAIGIAAAHVRLEEYEQAAQILAAADRGGDARAFHAIALVRLGRADEARPEIEAFRALAGQGSEDADILAPEIDALIPEPDGK